MTFSVIIPVYNGASHLQSAVSCLKRQSFADWECIIVDDGSTDGTSAQADRLAAADARVRVIHQPNGGVSVARNRGLDESRGDWIVWLDADDAYVDGAFERLAALVSAHPDCSAFQFPYLIGSTRIVPSAYTTCTGVHSGEEAFRILYVDPITAGQHWQPWRFVYRADAKPRFRPGVIHEDVDVLPRHLRTLPQVFISDEPLYVYTPAREGAATESFTVRRVRDILDVTAHNFGCGFDAMLAYNLWGYFKSVKGFPPAERKELLAEFRRHREWLAAIQSPRRTAWLKRLYAKYVL